MFALFFQQQKIIMDPLTYNEVRSRPSLEERLESIISGAALMADSSCTRDERRERIVQECNAVRQALQDLLTEYMNNVSDLLVSSSFVFWGFVEILLEATVSINFVGLWSHFRQFVCF